MVFNIFWGIWMMTILYVAVFFVRAGKTFRNGKADKSDTKDPSEAEGVSVIVCAHNELNNLQELLPLLLKQQYPKLQIVVVDDRSTDGTLDYLLQKQDERLKVVWLRERPRHIQGKKFALTMGIRAATYDKLLLTDADCLPNSHEWVSHMSKHLEGKIQIVLGYSPYVHEPGLLNSYIRYETLMTAGFYISAALRGFPYMGVGRNLAYRKSFFMENYGFRGHVHVMGGDDDLFVNQHAKAENTACSLSDKTKVVSKPKKSWKQYLIQKKRHLQVGKYYKNKDKKWLASVSFSHMFFWVGTLFLILGGYEPILIITGLIIKWLSQFYFLHKAAKRLKEPINLATLPILDFLFVIYYIILGLSAIFSKTTQWN